MSFPKYPKYKASGVEWLGEVPEHWDVWKLTHAFEKIGSGTTPKTDNREYYDDGEHPWVNTGDLNDSKLNGCENKITSHALSDHTTLRVYPAGSVVIAMYGATIGKLAILQFPACVNQACCVFSGKLKIEYKFLFFWLLGYRLQIISLAYGGGQPNINQDILRGLQVACPNLSEQNAIVAFLDRETAKIDELVNAQARLIELLKEKRQAVISHAVTKGLNPHAPMKPSGIEWLGDVPEHWEVVRLRWLCEIKKRIAGQLGYDVLSITQQGLRVRDITSNDGQLSMDYSKYQMVEIGDFAMNHMDLLTGYVDLASMRGVTSPDYRVFSIRDATACRSSYILFLFQMGYRNHIFYAYGQGSSQLGRWRMPTEAFKDLSFPLPPLPEQLAIAAFLDRETARIDTLTAEAQRAIILLRERRTALISAAVTGQIDIRNTIPMEVA